MILISSDSQVLVSNSLAALSGSTSQRIYCDSLNISVCPLTESSRKVTHRNVYAQAPSERMEMSPSLLVSQFSVSVYNPLARPVVWPVRLPVNGTAYVVQDAKGRSVDCEVCARQL